MEEKSDDAKVEILEPVAPAYYADKEERERPTCGPRSRLRRWGKWTWESNFGTALTFCIATTVFYCLWLGFMIAWLNRGAEVAKCHDAAPFFADAQLQSVRVFMKTLPQTEELSTVDDFIFTLIVGHLKSAIPANQAPLQQLNELALEKQTKSMEETVAELQQTIANFIKAQPTPIASRLGAIAYYASENAANELANATAFHDEDPSVKTHI